MRLFALEMDVIYRTKSIRVVASCGSILYIGRLFRDGYTNVKPEARSWGAESIDGSSRNSPILSLDDCTRSPQVLIVLL